MNARLHSFCLALVLLALSSCDDPAGPCDRSHACEFEGAHVVIESLAPRSTVVDQGTHLAVVEPDDLRLEVLLRNRGDTTSGPLRLILSHEHARLVTNHPVPPLEPGETYRGTIRLEPTPGLWLLEADTISILADLHTLDPNQEPVASARTAPFHLLVPALSFSIDPVSDSARLGGPFSATITVRNRSTRVEIPAAELQFRLLDPDMEFPAWGDVATLPVPPATTWSDVVVATIPVNAAYLLDGVWDYGAEACLELAGSSSSGEPGPICARSPHPVTVTPDLELCTGATAVVGGTVATPVVCQDPSYGDVGIWRIQAEAGRLLHFQLSNPGGGGLMMFMRRDGYLLDYGKNEARGQIFAETGTYYLAFWSAQNALLQPLTLTITDLTAQGEATSAR